MRKFIFYLILAIAAFGLMMNLDEFLFSIMKAIISFAIIALIIYIIYYFFFLT
ncbi:SA1362 family protein, partial [Staphylococcus epidermidis]